MAWSMHRRHHPQARPANRWDSPPAAAPGQRAEIHAPRAAELLDHPADGPTDDRRPNADD